MGNEVYVDTIDGVGGDASEGAFAPTSVDETWDGERAGDGDLRHGRRPQTLDPAYLEDSTDPGSSRDLDLIAGSGRRFDLFKAFDQRRS